MLVRDLHGFALSSACFLSNGISSKDSNIPGVKVGTLTKNVQRQIHILLKTNKSNEKLEENVFTVSHSVRLSFNFLNSRSE